MGTERIKTNNVFNPVSGFVANPHSLNKKNKNKKQDAVRMSCALEKVLLRIHFMWALEGLSETVQFRSARLNTIK